MKGFSLKIRVVLVEPEHEGNVGSIARLMKNFDLSKLWLVNPKVEIGNGAYSLAVHAGSRRGVNRRRLERRFGRGSVGRWNHLNRRKKAW
jgi:hypothetical protein